MFVVGHKSGRGRLLAGDAAYRSADFPTLRLLVLLVRLGVGAAFMYDASI